MTSEAKRASLPASPFSDEPRQKRETPRLQPLATNRHRASQPEETAMTSELRPAVEVVVDVLNAAERAQFTQRTKLQNAVGYVEADREAVRAEQAAELAKFKALAETLAGALEEAAYSVGMSSYDRHKVADKALLQYKEATQCG